MMAVHIRVVNVIAVRLDDPSMVQGAQSNLSGLWGRTGSWWSRACSPT